MAQGAGCGYGDLLRAINVTPFVECRNDFSGNDVEVSGGDDLDAIAIRLGIELFDGARLDDRIGHGRFPTQSYTRIGVVRETSSSFVTWGSQLGQR